MPTVQARHRTRKPQQRRKASAPTAVSAERVREILLEIAFVLHATRVVGRLGEAVAAKQG